MIRLYTNPGQWWRNTASLAIGVLAGVWGVWELWSAAQGPATHSSTGYLFGVAFIGGGIYAIRQVIVDAADRVMTFDRDPATGATLATLWRPFWTERLAAEDGRIGNWRMYVAIGKRNAKTFFVYADHQNYPRPLQFELKVANDLEGLRSVAPEAIEEFESATGKVGGGPAR
jgi:hypothetical protein